MEPDGPRANVAGPGFLAGVIEGFYGPPWSPGERRELFEWMAAWGLNTYLYAPKDDLKHRALWRDRYSGAEAEALGQSIEACRERRIRFVYALSPGLDIRYSDPADLERLQARLAQMLELGANDVALLFDDIPDRLDPRDLERYGSFAAAQVGVANALWEWVRRRQPGARFLFCPTAYCGRMAGRHLGGEGYLATLGRELAPEIDVFWSGPEIVSREIGVAHAREVQAVLRRPPLIWDNLHANDYDGRRFYCGPYAGRPPELRNEVRGLLCNPNCEFPLNYVPLRTFARYLQSGASWGARAAWESALREWLPRFAAVGGPVAWDDLVLFADCFYLPHEEGPAAEAFYRLALELVRSDPAGWGERAPAFLRQAAHLRDTCARLAALRDRPLFHALSRRAWELREELDLLERYVQLKAAAETREAPCVSDFHLPGTYRGGMAARLQALLAQAPDGSFVPAEPHAGSPPAPGDQPRALPRS